MSEERSCNVSSITSICRQLHGQQIERWENNHRVDDTDEAYADADADAYAGDDADADDRLQNGLLSSWRTPRPQF